jgi:hypothetical protein
MCKLIKIISSKIKELVKIFKHIEFSIIKNKE